VVGLLAVAPADDDTSGWDPFDRDYVAAMRSEGGDL
jgi:hypothetical protein